MLHVVGTYVRSRWEKFKPIIHIGRTSPRSDIMAFIRVMSVERDVCLIGIMYLNDN